MSEITFKPNKMRSVEMLCRAYTSVADSGEDAVAMNEICASITRDGGCSKYNYSAFKQYVTESDSE